MSAAAGQCGMRHYSQSADGISRRIGAIIVWRLSIVPLVCEHRAIGFGSAFG
jgi:hypothetical protein